MINTIGYSKNSISVFIQKLKENNITLVIDIRSKPYSRNPQFNRQYFERYLSNSDISYIYMGDCLGGLGINHDFKEAIEEVIRLSKIYSLVLMCVEGDPKKCHRYQTVAPEIEKVGEQVRHLLWD